MNRVVLVLISVLGATPDVQADSLALSEAVKSHVRTIHARNPERRDDTFSKMGGSSAASKAFLHCFATPHVDLGEHQHLAETVEYFNAARPNGFKRESEAAGVNWTLRYVLGGRPANFRQELGATQARYALVLFGGNDAQNENERIYLHRLVYLVEQLEQMGVIPVLGSALPRRNSYRDRWIRRFNAITEAVAKHWALPYIDYHGALSALPRKGLARDGVHPNVLGQGGVQTACQLTEEGLRYGNNLRNLLTLEMLDALRRETAPLAADTGTVGAAGAAPFPISTLVSKPSLPPTDSLPPNCGKPTPDSRLYRTRLELSERTRLRASGFDLEGYKPRVLWVRVDADGERCVRRRTQTLEVDAQAGIWDLIVVVPERAAQKGRMLILITRNPR